MMSALASAEECRPLYALLNQVKELSPWEWMEEDDLFGVQDPETGEIGFVSIMGMAGEHFAVGIYLGAKGLYGLMRLKEMDPFLIDPEDLLTIPQVQASFEDRELLDKRDRDQLKSLGLKFRGRKAWPQFRSFHPGYAPWYIETDEARFLALVLEQVLAVAPRVRENPNILLPGHERDFLVRVAEKSADGTVWHDKTMAINPPPPTELFVSITDDSLTSINQLPKRNFMLEADYFMMLSPVGSAKERPYFPYALFIVDANEGIPVVFQLIGPEPTHEEMWGTLGQRVLNGLQSLGSRPTEIRFRDDMLFRMLKPFEKRLGFRIKLVRDLPAFDLFASNLQNYM